MGGPRFVISHSWSRNMGDLAILLTTARMLRRAAPGCHVSALVSHPPLTARLCGGLDAELDGWVWPVPAGGKPGILELAGYPLIFANNILSAALFRLTKRRLFVFNRSLASPLRRFFDADVIISPGGDFMGPRYFFLTAFGEIIMARILGKRSIVCAQTIGPMEGLFHGSIAAPILNLADMIIVRDERSARDLRAAGVRRVEVTSDIVFGFDYEPKKTERRRTAILCPKSISGDRERYMGAFRALATRIVDELGWGVVFMPTDEHDIGFQREIASGIRRPGIEVVGSVRPPGETADAIAESGFIVSTRMHAIILGTLSGTPFFAIGDSHKFSGVLGSLSDGCIMDAESFGAEGAGRIVDAIRGRERLRKAVAAGFPEARRKALMNGSMIRSRLVEWGYLGKGRKHG